MPTVLDYQRQFRVAEEKAVADLMRWYAASTAAVRRLLEHPDLSLSEQEYFTALLQQVQATSTALSTEARKWTDETIGNAFVLGSQAQLPTLKLAGVNNEAIRALSTYTAGLIRNISNDMERAVRDEIALGLSRGASREEIAQRIRSTGLQAGRWASPEQRAGVVARTEIMRAYNYGSIAAIHETGTDRVRWIATDDERTCSICAPRNGEIFSTADIDIPAHPRCRCTVAAYYGEAEPAAPAEPVEELRALGLNRQEQAVAGPSFGFDLLPADNARHVLDGFSALASRFPMLPDSRAWRTLRVVRPGQAGMGGELASHQAGMVSLNAEYFSEPGMRKMREIIAKQAATGYAHGATVESAVYQHEIGHALDSYIRFDQRAPFNAYSAPDSPAYARWSQYEAWRAEGGKAATIYGRQSADERIAEFVTRAMDGADLDDWEQRGLAWFREAGIDL